MNCAAPLPGDDDGSFAPDDPMLPLPGHEPSDAGEEWVGPDPIWQGLALFAAVFLVMAAAVGVVVWWRG
jgi:hypothetical protein